jgi:hypothetical protein
MSLALLAVATGAFAQATRTWVSGVGSDANPCSRTAPCQTFAKAISVTLAGGEIDVLDPGGFGALTITKAVTIDGGGQVASVLASGTNGIVIQAGTSDVVTLRRLQINGIAGTGTGGIDGVQVLQASQVNIEDSVIFGFTTDGVQVVSSGPSIYVNIVNSTIENNGHAGVSVGNGGVVTITSCQLVGNASAGLLVAGSTSTPQVLVSSSNVSMNDVGILTGGLALVRLTENDIFANTTNAWQISSGVIETNQDNRVYGTPSGALTSVGTQ